ncbi:MAG TPA: MerR family DNA-binding transcriptional regulator [Bacillota bacterium]|nr:MerR family DNA-binding transcriptional regulator [Bacillota bacterium]
MADQTFTISELAAELEISTRTIRYYEELGLISPGRTAAGNQRIYNRRDRARLKLILRGKKFGFTLAEIKEMLDLYDVDPTREEQLKRTLQYGEEKLKEIDQKIEELILLKEDLLQMRQRLLDELEQRRAGKERQPP